MRRLLRRLQWLLSPLYRLWLGFARVLGRVNTFVLLAISFYVLVWPIGLVRRLLSKEPPAGWVKREPLSREHFRKQF